MYTVLASTGLLLSLPLSAGRVTITYQTVTRTRLSAVTPSTSENISAAYESAFIFDDLFNESGSS